MYGLVYHDQNHVPQLLVLEEGQITVGEISDDEHIYDAMPPAMGEIVEVQQSAKAIVGLKSICCLALHEHGVRFTRFYEGVESILNEEPSELMHIVLCGVNSEQNKLFHIVAEGAEVIEWPDGTCVLVEDYRPAQWTHMSDDFIKHWCSPNEMRKMGLL